MNLRREKECVANVGTSLSVSIESARVRFRIRRWFRRESSYFYADLTNKPGFDVTIESLKRQTYKDFTWIFGDSLYDLRFQLVEVVCEKADISVYHFKPPAIKKKYRRNLAAADNEALGWCRRKGIDLLIMLQDYIWVPEDGVERFVAMAKKFPNSLLTGVCSISSDPEGSRVVDPEGLYTIFGDPYKERPQWIFWHDSRSEYNYRGMTGYVESNPIECEWNWAAIPKSIIQSGINVDEEFDKGVAYENQAYAFECREKLGSAVVLDLDNRVLSLPHKRYPFGLGAPSEESDLQFNDINKALINKKWGAPTA